VRDVHSSSYGAREAVKEREPFFGWNAKAIAWQMALGLLILWLMTIFAKPLYDAFACTYLFPSAISCQTPPATALSIQFPAVGA
jgi:hypothetical protein